MSIVLSQVIADVTLEVGSAGLPDGAGGVALRFELNDGLIAFTPTDAQDRWLVTQIDRHLVARVDAMGGV